METLYWVDGIPNFRSGNFQFFLDTVDLRGLMDITFVLLVGNIKFSPNTF